MITKIVSGHPNSRIDELLPWGYQSSECPGTLKTPLGDDVLVLKSFGADEGLGELFAIHIEALSEQENIDFDRALGQACTVKLKTTRTRNAFFAGS